MTQDRTFTQAVSPTFAEALRVWAKIGVLSFGGPAGQIALMHRVLVDEKRWIDERQFLPALNFCMLLPGPEAMQLATYVGWRLHGVRGGLAAGLLFVLPGALLMLALALLYAAFGQLPISEALFTGVKAAVLAIVDLLDLTMVRWPTTSVSPSPPSTTTSTARTSSATRRRPLGHAAGGAGRHRPALDGLAARMGRVQPTGLRGRPRPVRAVRRRRR